MLNRNKCRIEVNSQEYRCPFQVAIDILDGKWKGLILWYLMTGKKRNSEFRRLIPDITQKMLTQKLRELEDEGIVERKVYPVVPPKVEYSLSDQGKKLEPILKALYQWGENYVVARNGETILEDSVQAS